MTADEDGAGPAPAGLPGLALIALVVALATAVALSAGDVAAGLVARTREVASLDPLSLRRLHDGWFVRMEPVVAAIEARVPAGSPLLIEHQGVPAWFVAARLVGRPLYESDPETEAALRASGPAPWRLVLRQGDPLDWRLLPPGNEAPGGPR